MYPEEICDYLVARHCRKLNNYVDNHNLIRTLYYIATHELDMINNIVDKSHNQCIYCNSILHRDHKCIQMSYIANYTFYHSQYKVARILQNYEYYCLYDCIIDINLYRELPIPSTNIVKNIIMVCNNTVEISDKTVINIIPLICGIGGIYDENTSREIFPVIRTNGDDDIMGDLMQIYHLADMDFNLLQDRLNMLFVIGNLSFLEKYTIVDRLLADEMINNIEAYKLLDNLDPTLFSAKFLNDAVTRGHDTIICKYILERLCD